MKQLIKLLYFSALILTFLNLSACRDDEQFTPGEVTPPPVEPADTSLVARLHAVGIDSIIAEAVVEDGFLEQYTLVVNQYLDHEKKSGLLQQRIRLAHKGFDKPTVIHTQGYNLEDYSLLNHEMAMVFDANIMEVEHRLFHHSCPEEIVENLEYFTTEQQIEDLHHIRGLFDKIYPGIWISTGASKGGTTSMVYKCYYPEDVDIVVPYVAPICNSINDKRAGDWIHYMAGTPAMRDSINVCRQFLFNILSEGTPESNPVIAQFAEKRNIYSPLVTVEADGTQKPLSPRQVQQMLATYLLTFDGTFWNYDNQWGLEIMPIEGSIYSSTERIVDWFIKLDLVIYNRITASVLQNYKEIITDFTQFIPATKGTRAVYDYTVGGVVDHTSPYYFQAVYDQGNVDFMIKGDVTIPDPELNSYVDRAIEHSQTVEEFIGIMPEILREHAFKATDALYKKVTNYYKEQDPYAMFIYGRNDIWTGAGVNDELHNAFPDNPTYPYFGFDKKQHACYYIVEGHGHPAMLINTPDDAQFYEMRDKLHRWKEELTRKKAEKKQR